jgi:hypothetical protein
MEDERGGGGGGDGGLGGVVRDGGVDRRIMASNVDCR